MANISAAELPVLEMRRIVKNMLSALKKLKAFVVFFSSMRMMAHSCARPNEHVKLMYVWFQSCGCVYVFRLTSSKFSNDFIVVSNCGLGFD